MKRSEEEFEDALLTPSSLAVKVKGLYEAPQEDLITVEGTNRDSTVMPEMRANLGLVPYAMKQMGAKTLLRHHKITKAARKNKDILDTEPMNFMEASELNDHIKSEQSFKILQKMAERDRAAEEEKKVSNAKKWMVVIGILGIVAVIALFGFFSEIGGDNNQEENEPEDDQITLLVNNINLSEEGYRNICQNFGQTFSTAGLCLGDKAVFCNEGVPEIEEPCDCVCEGSLSQELQCGSRNCTTNYLLEPSIDEDADIIESFVNFGNQCSLAEEEPEPICFFDNILFSCRNSGVEIQRCSQNCENCEED